MMRKGQPVTLHQGRSHKITPEGFIHFDQVIQNIPIHQRKLFFKEASYGHRRRLLKKGQNVLKYVAPSQKVSTKNVVQEVDPRF